VVVRALNEVKKGFQKSAFLKNKNFQRITLGIAVFLIITSILAFDFVPKTVDIKAGEPSAETIKASRTIEFVDNKKTEEQKEAIALSVEEIYKRDITAITRVEEEIRDFFLNIKDVRAVQLQTETAGESGTVDKAAALKARLEKTKERVGSVVSDGTLAACLTITDDEVQNLEQKMVDVVKQVMSGNIMEGDLANKRKELGRIFAALNLPMPQIKAATEIGGVFIEPNYYYDAEQTQKLRNEAIAKVRPYTVKKVEGEIIVREGEIVTEEQVKILTELGLLKKRIEVNKIASIALLVLGMIFVMAIYIYKFQKEVFENAHFLLLLAILLIFVTLVAKIITPFFSSYLIPVAAAAMIATILLGNRMGVIIVLTSSLATSQIVGNSSQYLAVAILSGLFAVYLVSNISHRGDLTRAGIWLSLALVYLCFAVGLVFDFNIVGVLKNMGWGLASGISSAILTIGALPFFEAGFHITTDIKLLELANSSQLLLRELMVNAPGTYNHSVMVGNLAEAAAEEVKASPLLARAGSYYHDIGKLKRPFFFVENQIGGENPHDRTNPSLSYLIISAHVKDGVEMAKKHRLPNEVIKIINQHHGTGLISYFYHRAKEAKSKHEVLETQFRYSGEKPETKEAAIIMLADSIEAAARTISKLSPSRLEQLVKKIIQDKLDDGQLDKSNLTLSDLEKIARAFSQMLSSIYHSRIEYPDLKVVSSSKGLLTYGDFNKR